MTKTPALNTKRLWTDGCTFQKLPSARGESSFLKWDRITGYAHYSALPEVLRMTNQTDVKMRRCLGQWNRCYTSPITRSCTFNIDVLGWGGPLFARLDTKEFVMGVIQHQSEARSPQHGRLFLGNITCIDADAKRCCRGLQDVLPTWRCPPTCWNTDDAKEFYPMWNFPSGKKHCIIIGTPARYYLWNMKASKWPA